jgi:uncharacterized protein (TIGR04255 family)
MRYAKAPIKEAIFDVRVDKVSNLDIDSYLELIENKLSDYPKFEKQYIVSGQFKIDRKNIDVTSEQQAKKTLGIVYFNEADNIKIQFRKDGFTLNMLEPYSQWSEFSSLAFKFWEIYKDEIKPNKITRIALRYINKLNLPLDGHFNFDDYLTNMPKLPDVFEDSFSDFLLRTGVICKDSGNPVILTRRMERPNEGFLPFIIDIDVFKKDGVNPDNLVSDFEILRKNKNDIFESLIKDKTRSLFK